MTQKDERETVFLWSSGGLRSEPGETLPATPRAGPGRSAPQSPADSRRYPRLDLKLPILYRVLGEDLSRLPATVRPILMARSRDVSPLGLCMSLAEPLRTGAVLALTIHAVGSREKFEAMARVVWIRPSEDGVHTLTGLQFVVVDGGLVREEGHARMEELIRSLAAPFEDSGDSGAPGARNPR